MNTEHRRRGVPRRKKAAVGVLCPARRRDVEVDVAGLHAEPVHRRQMPDRIALVAVQDELGLGRRAGGEIEQQRIARPGLAVRHELRRRLVGRLPGKPARRRPADDDARVVAWQIGEFSGIVGAGHDMPHTAAREAVVEIIAVQQGRRWNDHGAELHRRQHAFPQRCDIAEHQQQAVAAADAEGTQPVGDPIRPLGEFGKGELGFAAAVIDKPQTRAVVAARHRVEIIERPVEPVERRPAEVAIGPLVIPAMGEQEIARLEKSRRRHARSSRRFACKRAMIAQAGGARPAYRAT
jgi:hypothetical protein